MDMTTMETTGIDVLRARIIAAMQNVDCGCTSCRERPDYKPGDCDNHICNRNLENNKKRTDAVVDVLPQPHGLSIREQSDLLWAICRYGNGQESCPYIMIPELSHCPFMECCEEVEKMDWLSILERRVIPDTNK